MLNAADSGHRARELAAKALAGGRGGLAPSVGCCFQYLWGNTTAAGREGAFWGAANSSVGLWRCLFVPLALG